MILPLLVAASFLASAPPLEQVRRQITREYERVGRTAPLDDPALDRAAHAIAERALSQASARAAVPNAIDDAVSDASGFDPAPRAIVIRAAPPSATLAAFLARTDVPSDPASVVGAGWAEDGAHGVAVVLLAQRKISLAPFPRSLPRSGLRQTLSGRFTSPLSRPELLLTTPAGTVRPSALRLDGQAFQGELSFPVEGRYTVELLARGDSGPEVVALFHVDVGNLTRPAEASQAAEPATAAAARSQILERVNRLRAQQGIPPLAQDDALGEVAQRYAEQMAREHFFAHVDPSGATVSTRLRQAGVLYQRAGENLGLAEGPLAAEDGIERSPGHRQNLLDPAFTRLGTGLAVETLPDRTQTLLVQILANPQAAPPDARDAGSALWSAIAQKRRGLHLAPLRHSETLDRLALERAQAALAADSVDAPPSRKVEPQVFSALPDARRAAVDLFVTSDVRALPPSRALADPANDVLGFAAIPGNSRRYGADKFWVVVVYASTR